MALQLPMQSVPITSNVVSLNPAQARCALYTTLCDKFVNDLLQVVVFSGYSGFLHHDIAEILLKVALSTIILIICQLNSISIVIQNII